MIPFKDENPTELVPFITFAILAANVGAWVLVQGMGSNLGGSVCAYGLIPVEVTGRPPVGPDVCPLGGLTWGAVLTSMFMHGGWFHLITNMMFLWVFGNNVEDSMGHVRFLVFYLLCGIAAALVHVMLNAGSTLPTVGASGAISGVLGAYVVLYPSVRIHVFFPPFFILPMRAWVVLGYWIVIQVVMALAETRGAASGGVAVWAHVGGFFTGMLLVKPFQRPQLVEAKREGRQLDRSEIRAQRYWW